MFFRIISFHLAGLVLVEYDFTSAYLSARILKVAIQWIKRDNLYLSLQTILNKPIN